jgi:hypothetical protein
VAEAPEGFYFLLGKGEDFLDVEVGAERLDACGGARDGGCGGGGLGRWRWCRKRWWMGGCERLRGRGRCGWFWGERRGCVAAEALDLFLVGFLERLY